MKMAEAIERYIKLRDERDARRKEFQEEIRKRYTEPMDKIEAAFLKHFDKSGSDNCKAKGIGTAYISQRVSDTVVDRSAFFEWVRENDAFDFLENKVNKSAVDQFIEAEGDLPPGVNRRVEQRVNIRRS